MFDILHQGQQTDQTFSRHTFLTCEHELRVLKWPAREKSPGLPSSYCVPAKTSSSRSRWLSSTTRSESVGEVFETLPWALLLFGAARLNKHATACHGVWKKEQRRKEPKKKISTACFNIRRTPGHLTNCYFRLWFIIFVAVTHSIFITWNGKNKGVQFNMLCHQKNPG